MRIVMAGLLALLAGAGRAAAQEPAAGREPTVEERLFAAYVRQVTLTPGGELVGIRGFYEGDRDGSLPSVQWLYYRPTDHRPLPPPRLSMDWLAFSALVAGQAADGISTYRFLHNGSGCAESNPRLGPHPGVGAIVRHKAVAVGTGVALQVLFTRLGNHAEDEGGRRVARWAARGLAYLGAGFGAKAAVHNVRMCGW